LLPLRTIALALSACFCAPAASSDSLELGDLFEQIRWVAYSPTLYNPDAAPPTIPGDDSIRTDLQALRRAGFDGIITYGATIPSILTLAGQEGFSAALLGVWDPSSQQEISIAEAAAVNPLIKGIIVGNEGLTFGRYTPETLHRAMQQIRSGTGKPVSTTEVIEVFYTNQDLIDWSDFITVNAHAYYHGHRDPVRAVDWTFGAWQRLTQQIQNKPIVFKEVGLPTAGNIENTEQSQSEFYFGLLTTTGVKFAFFEGFDQLYKQGQVEESWGLFKADRSPKTAAGVLLDAESCTGPIRRSWCAQ
jgi:exo-beta-1,3-glucanase (GH17 family)